MSNPRDLKVAKLALRMDDGGATISDRALGGDNSTGVLTFEGREYIYDNPDDMRALGRRFDASTDDCRAAMRVLWREKMYQEGIL